MIRIDIHPNTPEWLAWRKGGIGSSDIAKIMGVSSYGTAIDVYNDKAGIGEAKKKNAAMQRGNDYEPIARAKFCKLMGKEFKSDPYQRISLPFVRASLDGFCVEDKETLEIKVPNKKVMDMAAIGEVTTEYYYQMQWQMFVVDAIRGYFVCFNPDTNEMYIVTVAPDYKLIESMKIAATKFWNDFLMGISPDAQKDDIEQIVDDQFITLALAARKIKGEINRWEGEWEAVKSHILKYENGRSFQGYGITVAKANGRKSYDIDAMASDGIDIEKYAKIGKESWTLKIDK